MLQLEEPAPLVWFTWNAAWDFRGAPHPGVFVNHPASPRGQGVVRVGVPATVVTLRWRVYVSLNGEPRALAKAIAELDPTDWLATPHPVPASLVRSLEAWYRDRWVDAALLDEDFDAWVAETR